MNRSDIRVVGCFLVVLGLLSGPAFSQESPKPWENPNSGFSNTPTTTTTTTTPGGTTTSATSGYDKIDKVITGGGSTTHDGKTISTEGTDTNSKTGQTNKSFVDGFLNSAAGKTGVVSASAWSWTKSWKIGPDGKPMEVRESYHHGKLGVTGTSAPAPTGGVTYTPSPGTSGSTPAAAPTAAPAGSPSPVAAPSPAASPSPTTGPAATPAPVAAPTGTAAKPTAPAPVPAPVGVDPAPPKLPTSTPNQTVILTIRDPLSNSEQSFNNTIDPATTARAVPEDTRARFGLDLGKDINPDKVQVKIDDPEDPKDLPFSRSFHHIFRTASNDKYRISVIYPDTNGTPRPILTVQVPVYKMGFRNQTIDSSQRRGDESQAPTAGTTSSGNTSNSSSYGVQSENSAAEEKNDLSDLYTDPTNPPKVSGNGTRDNTIGVPGANGGSQSASTDGDTAGTGSSGQGANGNTQGTNAAGQPGQQVGSTGSAGQAGTTGAAGQGRGSTVSGNAGNGQQTANGQIGNRAAGTGAQGNSTAGAASGNANSQRGSSGSSAGFAAAGSSSGGSSGGSSGSSSSGSSSSGSSGSSFGSSLNSGSSNAGASGNQGSSGGEGAYAVDASSGGDGNPGGSSDADAPAVADPRAQGMGKGLQVASNRGGVTTAENTTADSYLLSVSMRDAAGEVGQSFDFTSDPYPTSQPVKVNSNLQFSVDLSKKVQRDRTTVVLFNGVDKKQYSLADANTDVFQCQFKNPTTEAYVWIYGDAEGKPFSYKVSIPIQ